MTEDPVQLVEIDWPTEHPDNPRRGDVGAIARSLGEFGQITPIVVQKSSGYVVKGNHTLKAAKKLGWSTIKVLIVDMDDDKAKRYALADNLTSDRAGTDKAAFYDMAASLASLDGTSLSEGDLESMMESLSGKKEEKKAAPVVEEIKLEDRPSEQSTPTRDPVREIPLLVPASKIQAFGQQIVALQQLWEVNTLMEVIERAVSEAHSRWQAAASGRIGSEAALPQELVGTEY